MRLKTLLAASLIALVTTPALADLYSENFAQHQYTHLYGNAFYTSQCDYGKVGQPGQPCGDGYRLAEIWGTSAESLPSYGHIEGRASATMPAGGEANWHWGTTHVFSRWGDWLTVESSTLPVGTPVTLDLRINWSHSISIDAGAGSLTRAQASLHYSGPDCCNLITLVQGNHYDTTDPGSVGIGSFNTFVGNSIYFVGVLSLDADITGGTVGGTAYSVGSADYFITPQAGVSLRSASGHNYSISAVPEPASLALWACGLVGLVGQLSRQRRRNS
ncbi:PEP-CTERM sorting domain-containing protein [Roseateles paludis]|jgi:hypothetical protein|uniref:PEP-CTERM sorting domain-containing protein n=1 Tax=Roseateles paludis TaxID=3145238 RepID=A0ABV0FZB3_9BURK